jgi:REP element-mobilizing transposase RayT
MVAQCTYDANHRAYAAGTQRARQPRPYGGMTMTNYDPTKHHRHSIRLAGYDYAQAGVYFVTICTQNRECLLGDVIDNTMRLSTYGRIATEWWNNIPDHFDNAELDGYVAMPNHLHGIIVLHSPETGTPRRTLGQIIAYFKYQSTKSINDLCDTPGRRFWQRNYYEHIVQNETELNRVREYIINNPVSWVTDDENLAPCRA